MTDREILEEVYRRLKESDDPHGWKTNPLKDGVTSFIEREWQKQDGKGSPPPKWVKEDWRKSYEPTKGEDFGPVGG